MPRPTGHRISARAWEDVLRLTGRSLTEISKRADMPRATLSSLVGGHHRASISTAHNLAEAVEVHPETLFPTLNPRYELADTDTEVVPA